MKSIILSISILALTGCASMGTELDLSKLDTFKTCQTSKSEMVEVFGKPLQVGRQSGYKTAKWFYSYVGFFQDFENQNVIAFYNDDNIMVDYLLNPVGSAEIFPVDKCK